MGRAGLMVLVTVAILAGAVGTAVAGGPRAQAARLHLCRSRVDFNLTVSSSRNMLCRTAAHDIRRYHGSIARRFTTPGHFRCHRVSGNRLAGQWRCVRRTRAYRFEFGD
jgi:hypothetical protein